MVYQTGSSGFNYLWNNYDSTDKLKFKLSSNIFKDISTADNTLDVINMNNLNIFQVNKKCPMADIWYGTPQFTGTQPRLNENIDSDGLCPNLKSSCCEEKSFITFRDNWKYQLVGKTMVEKTLKNVYNFFIKDLTNVQYFAELPDKSRFCSDPTKKEECVEKFSLISLANLKAQKGINDYIGNQEKCSETINKLKTQSFCSACDETSLNAIDVEKKEVKVSNSVINSIIENCYEAKFYSVNSMIEVGKAYFDYANLINKFMGIDSDEFDFSFNGIRTIVLECQKFMIGDNDKSKAYQNKYCYKLAQFQSLNIFSTTMQIRFTEKFYNFIKILIKNIGTERAIE